MGREYLRQVVVFEDHFKKFRKTLGREALKKLYHVLTLVMLLEKVPKKFLRVIEGKKGLYEIRSEYVGDAYRVFCCFDEGNLIILFNGFQKKTQKTPQQQLDKSEELMRKYFEQKKMSGNEE